MKQEISGIIIVLGSPNDSTGKLSGMALERCSQALLEHREHPDYAILPTGGWGEHFNSTDKPHWFYVKQELLSRGVPELAFLTGVDSSNTIEDASLSHTILDANPQADMIVVTSDFHAARAKFLFDREYPERQIRMSTSLTRVNLEDHAKLLQHEKRALAKLKGKGLY